MVNKFSIQANIIRVWNVSCWLLLSQFAISAVSADANTENTQPGNISINELLKKYVSNGSKQLFDGTFVYLFEDSLQTIKVHREKNEQGIIVENFIPLDGNQKKSSRLLSNQFCTLNNGWPYQFQAVSSSFPFRINNYLNDLQKNYELSLSAKKIVAGTSVVGLTIKARDPYRYGYKLWFEPETGSLLKYELISQKDKVIEQYLFTDIEFNHLSTTSDTPVSAAKDILSCHDEFQDLLANFDLYFAADKIPAGYEPVSFRKGMINRGGLQAYQFQLSDGIASVSIFIEQIRESKHVVNGVVKMGPVNVAGKTFRDYQVTVLGAIPVVTALHFLKAIKEPEK